MAQSTESSVCSVANSDNKNHSDNLWMKYKQRSA